MRTTIRIDDDLYRAVKERAARSGRTVGAVIEDAVRAALSRPHGRSRDRLSLPTYGGEGPMPGVDLADNAALRNTMDRGAGLDALR